MRLHRLEITAFGPFAGSEEVDFDTLADGGLFLLCGPTGAGKTSVLDAVCFGLYGEVPGDRQAARHLRCDRAAPGVVPEVRLTVSIAGRTFRFTRSPAWDRPKKRGTGTVREQARVVVEEQTGDGWRGLTTRLDEAGGLVGDLLGMTCTQFTQVALLPQGQFQKFLHASSAERQAVLQRLFRTDRFERVEAWLGEHRRSLGRLNRSRHDEVAGMVHRLEEVSGCAVPEAWDLHDLTAPAEDGALAEWAVQVRTSTAAAAAEAEQLRGLRTQEHAAAREALDEATRRDGLYRRGRAARATLEELDATSEPADEDRRRLDAHRRALPVRSWLTDTEAAEEAHRSALKTAADAAAAAGLDEHTSAAEAAVRRDAAVAELTRAESAHELEQAAAATRREHDEAVTRRETTEAELARVEKAAATLPERRQALTTQVASAEAAQASLERHQAEVERATTGLEAATELVAVRADLKEARAEQQACIDALQASREAYLDAREARINAIAGELATGLVAGCACPVCGSDEHPQPASGSGTVTREAEETARKAVDDAEILRLSADQAVASLTARQEALTATAEHTDVPTWKKRLEDARRRLDEQATTAAALDDLHTALRELDADAARLGADRESAQSAHAEAVARVETLAQQVRSTAERLATVLGEAADAATLVATARSAADRLRDAVDAFTERDQAERELAGVRRRAAEACEAAGFADLTDVRRALLPAEEASSLEALLADRDRRRTTAAATLSEPDVAQALEGEPVDLAALTEAEKTVAAAARTAAAEAASHATRAARSAELAKELTDALTAWEPLRSRLRLVTDLSAFVEGRSVDNPLRVSLSAYVLGERLRQVVAAANERLARMSAGRYALEHVDQRGVGSSKGGLGLRVRDEWSGIERDPVTLSGGETFVVSLALALGLADTVTHEAGGTEIGTLFVDEGFGSLDADTLDDVMDVLDGLREGGRVVGVVSHVSELRERITTRLDVRKGRAGSTLTVC